MFRYITFLTVFLSSASIVNADALPMIQIPFGNLYMCADYLKSVKQGDYSSYKNKKQFTFVAEFAEDWADGYVSAAEYAILGTPDKKLNLGDDDLPAKNYLRPYCEKYKDSSVSNAATRYAEDYLQKHMVTVSDKQLDADTPTAMHLRAGGMRCKSYNDGTGPMEDETVIVGGQKMVLIPYIITDNNANEWFAGFITGMMELAQFDRIGFLDSKYQFTGIDYLKKNCKKQPEQRVVDIAAQYLREHGRPLPGTEDL